MLKIIVLRRGDELYQSSTDFQNHATKEILRAFCLLLKHISETKFSDYFCGKKKLIVLDQNNEGSSKLAQCPLPTRVS